MGVLREDGVSPVVCVRVRDGLDSGPQQLVPQEGGIGHGVCREGSTEQGEEDSGWTMWDKREENKVSPLLESDVASFALWF